MGIAQLTLPARGGTYNVTFFHKEYRLFTLTPAKLSIETGFQPGRVVRTRDGEDDAVVFEDSAGRTATLSGAEGVLTDGQAEILFRTALPRKEDLLHVAGRVANRDGEPVADALVALGTSFRDGHNLWPLHIRTGSDGRFAIGGLDRKIFDNTLQPEVFLMVKRDGYGGVETNPVAVDLAGNDAPVDLGTIRLSRGHSLRLRVLRPDGEPAVGAWVMPSGDHAIGSRFTRTNAEGRCEIRGLPIGALHIYVHLGQILHSLLTVVVEDDPEEVLVRLSPPREVVPAEVPAAPAEPRRPLAVGEQAPEWSVAAWTDGMERKLSDYRGKVVVIDVWGVWCSACLNAIPGLKDVQQRFRDRNDVVFLTIHSAGTELDEVRSLMRRTRWDWATGLDEGENVHDSATVVRFHVRFFPTTLVVGRDGTVAFNDDDGADEVTESEIDAWMKKIADELNIAWPFSDDVADEDRDALLNRMFVHELSQAIEAALRSP
jgi:thiol-disulfide isomerase/thioredoxin